MPPAGFVPVEVAPSAAPVRSEPARCGAGARISGAGFQGPDLRRADPLFATSGGVLRTDRRRVRGDPGLTISSHDACRAIPLAACGRGACDSVVRPFGAARRSSRSAPGRLSQAQAQAQPSWSPAVPSMNNPSLNRREAAESRVPAMRRSDPILPRQGRRCTDRPRDASGSPRPAN